MVVVATLAGCYQPNGEQTCTVTCPDGVCPNGMTCGGDGLCRSSPSDDCAAIGDASLPDSNQVCVGQGLIKNFCFARPAAPFAPAAGVLMTDVANCTTTLMQASGPLLCVFIGTRVSITGTLRVVGSNPVVFVGVDEVSVGMGAILDVSSKVNEVMPGAGASGQGCAAGSPAGSAGGQVGGGGAGGTFRSRGGGGGSGIVTSSVAGGGASSSALVTVATVRGGCAGSSGGDGTPDSRGVGGLGGGGVYLVSANKISIAGFINASGAGGHGGGITSGGGGGGGTGGFIGLDAPVYDIATDARVFAIGGSGGAGANSSVTGGNGDQADGPTPPTTTLAPAGAGSGGAGGATTNGTNGGTATAGGGGGGGGGTGYIGVTNNPPIPPMVFAPAPVSMN
jgi:hypothetical protein